MVYVRGRRSRIAEWDWTGELGEAISHNLP